MKLQVKLCLTQIRFVVQMTKKNVSYLFSKTGSLFMETFNDTLVTFEFFCNFLEAKEIILSFSLVSSTVLLSAVGLLLP